MAHISKQIVVHAPFSLIKPFIMEVERWVEWYVGLSAPEQVTGTGEEGTYSEHTYLLAGHEYPIRHTVSEVELGDVSGHWKGTFEGSFQGWHRWTYAPVNGNTEVKVEHEYTLPGKLLGRIVDALVIERMIARNLEHSLETLQMLCEESIPAA